MPTVNEGKPHYVASPANNVVVSTGAAILEKVIVGADVASAVIEISDSPNDGNGDIKIRLAGSTLMTAIGGEIDVNATFQKGICADIVNQTHVTFVWRTMPS